MGRRSLTGMKREKCSARGEGPAFTILGVVQFILGLLLAHIPGTAHAQTPVVLENAHVRYMISAEGMNLGFVDRATGTDYLRRGAPSRCAVVRCKGKDFPATSVVYTNDHLSLNFGNSGASAIVGVELIPFAIRFAVESIQGNDVESLVFVNIPLSLVGRPNEPFGACALALNVQTRVDQLPALQSELRAVSYAKFGLGGAKVALVGMPMTEMLPALKEVLRVGSEMPICKVAGPWAQETPFSHGSYLFNFGAMTETNVADWISMVRSLGLTQIDNHGGSAFFRFGDLELNRQKWPDGWGTFERINARLHAAGIGSIFHTYAFFIDKGSRYVTPVPDRRLDAFRTFTLAESLTPETNEIQVVEPTKGMSTVTGFFEQNSVVLHIGDELVTFSGASQEPPWRFTGVKRGAFGTRATDHATGDKARHLKECFGLFVPNPESDLFEEIAANHAAIVNRCDFDGMYLDAIDGSSILRGADEAWYWASKFVIEVQKRLQKPTGMEMSAMWHQFWQYRTRWQAWDFPQRGYKRFIDIHAASNNGGLLLPHHLGWWNFVAFNPPQVEPTYPEVIEYLGAKLIGWDAGISLTGAIDREALQKVPLFGREVNILRTCEQLRHAGAFDEKTRALLREPGQEFSLVTDATGKTRFCRSHSLAHTVAAAEPWTLTWRVANPYVAQPLRLRLEALTSPSAYDDPRAVTLADPAGSATEDLKISTAKGVTASLATSAGQASRPTRELRALNAGKVPRNGAWVRLEKRFSPTLSLKALQTVGIRLEGDGLGEIVAVRLESPRAVAFGALADHYIPIDFIGPRVLTLVETESSRWSDYVWNDGKATYNVYRETINFGAVESVSVWYQNLPPGQEVRCGIGAVKALPMLTGTVKNPRIVVNGSSLEFPVTMTSGSWIECNGLNDCTLYGPKGELLAKVTLQGTMPLLQAGNNEAQFSCAELEGPSPRAKVTVFSRGETL